MSIKSNENVVDKGFVDKKPPSKKPWLALGVVIIIVVFGLQVSLNTVRSKIAKKGGESLELMNAPELKNDVLSAPIGPIVDEEKESLKKKIALLADALQKQQEMLNSKSSLASKIKSKLTPDLDLEKMLKAKASLSLGVSEKNKESINSSNPQDELLKKMSAPQEENSNLAFLNQNSKSDFETEDAIKIENLELKILEGKAIKGVLDSAIDSDLPGLIKAHVTQDVYGEEGTIVLVPNGSQLIGKYRSGFFPNGAVRVFVIWTRIKIPGGISIKLNSAGSDQIGRAGMTGNVDSHYVQRFGSSFLMSMLSFGVSTAGVSSNAQYNSKAAVRMGVAESFSNTANQGIRYKLVG